MNTAHSSAGSYGSIGRLASTGDPDSGYTQRDYKDKDLICPRINRKATRANFWSASCLRKQLQNGGACVGSSCAAGLALLKQHGLMSRQNPKDNKRTRQKRADGTCFSKLNEQDVVAIRAMHKAGATCVAISKQYSVTAVSIQNIVKRNSWKHVL